MHVSHYRHVFPLPEGIRYRLRPWSFLYDVFQWVPQRVRPSRQFGQGCVEKAARTRHRNQSTACAKNKRHRRSHRVPSYFGRQGGRAWRKQANESRTSSRRSPTKEFATWFCVLKQEAFRGRAVYVCATPLSAAHRHSQLRRIIGISTYLVPARKA